MLGAEEEPWKGRRTEATLQWCLSHRRAWQRTLVIKVWASCAGLLAVRAVYSCIKHRLVKGCSASPNRIKLCAFLSNIGACVVHMWDCFTACLQRKHTHEILASECLSQKREFERGTLGSPVCAPTNGKGASHAGILCYAFIAVLRNLKTMCRPIFFAFGCLLVASAACGFPAAAHHSFEVWLTQIFKLTAAL